MFQKGYLLNELRRRWGRTIVTSLGLAVGVGLVIGIIGVSQGLSKAQNSVLSPLQAIGTDILVTRVAGATTTASTTTAAPQPGGIVVGPGGGGGGGGFFGAGGGGGQGGGGPNGAAVALNNADTQALLNENSNVVTDLAKLGPAGTKFTHDFFLSSTLLSFPQEAVTETASVPGVASAVAGLTQLAEHQTGTVPTQTASFTTGGETLTHTVTPAPLTAAEQADVQACLAKNGVQFGGAEGGAGTTRTATPRQDGGGGRGFGALQDCLPQRIQQYQATFRTQVRTIEQAVNPPSTDINTTSYTAAGIDPANSGAGLVTAAQLVSGRWVGVNAPTEVLVNQSYANQHSLALGSQIPINGTNYTVVGLVKPTLTGSIADVYFPLATLQNLAGKSGRITQILVKVKDAASVNTVAAQIQKALPGATVITTQSLADQVTGSLSDAKKLTDRLGGVLGVIVVASAFVIAMLLTLSSIGKRVREIGTLRAIGWSRGRVVRQILAETVGIGLVGGLLGIGLGYAASAAVSAFSPSLQATAQGVAGFGGSSIAGLFRQSTSVATTSATVHLIAPIHVATLGIGVALAVLGGLIAGGVGAARAARLSPAEALRNLA